MVTRKNEKMGLVPQVITAVVLAAVFGLTYLGIDFKCSDFRKGIDTLKQEEATLDKEYKRQDALWNEKLTPENLDSVLMRHGLVMESPPPHRILSIDDEGRPVPGQVSLIEIQKALLSVKLTTSTAN